MMSGKNALEGTTSALAEIRRMQRGGYNLRQIAAELGGAVTAADVSRLLRGIEPKGAKKRHALGLPALIPAPACPHCGQVHVSKRCPHRRRNHRDLFSQPAELLRWRLENRGE